MHTSEREHGSRGARGQLLPPSAVISNYTHARLVFWRCDTRMATYNTVFMATPAQRPLDPRQPEDS
eukprot:2824149-Prymnesium_polylepis.1